MKSFAEKEKDYEKILERLSDVGGVFGIVAILTLPISIFYVTPYVYAWIWIGFIIFGILWLVTRGKVDDRHATYKVKAWLDAKGDQAIEEDLQYQGSKKELEFFRPCAEELGYVVERFSPVARMTYAYVRLSKK